MGCDIHLHIEIKLYGRWEHYAAPKLERRYGLFERIAGVRGEAENAIIPARGMPNDITMVTRFDAERMAGDAHSHSWLGLDEIVKLEDWLVGQGGFKEGLDLEHHILHCYLFGNSFAGVRKYPEDYRDKPVKDVRFVFWFDN